MISEKDLLASPLLSINDPALYNTRVKKHQVYLIPPSGSVLKGRFAGTTLHRTEEPSLQLNRPVGFAPIKALPLPTYVLPFRHVTRHSRGATWVS
jgi:hypothetical protein